MLKISYIGIGSIRYANALEYSVYDLHTKVKKYLNMDTGSNAY